MPTLDTLTPQQLDASLADASKNVNPAEVKPATLLEQLSRHRRVLQKYRAKGYSADQLATFLRQPSIGISVSPSLIRKVLRKPSGSTQVEASRTPRGLAKYKAILTPVTAGGAGAQR